MILPDRKRHQQEIERYIQKHFKNLFWDFSLPAGTGNETYIVRSDEESLFVKLGIDVNRYQVVASINLTPPILETGMLEDGTSFIIQPFIDGIRPSRKDYHQRLDQFALSIHQLHHNTEVMNLLPQVTLNSYRDAGLSSLAHIQEKWRFYKSLVPNEAYFVDKSIDYIKDKLVGFVGSGLVVSHNDICNYNWLLSTEGRLYLIDLDSMSLDDPALDIGATLWWYYPPVLRSRFLEVSGFLDDTEFTSRMQVRMAMHCLNIELPRADSYEKFDSSLFWENLTDFKAALAGEENPQGYL